MNLLAPQRSFFITSHKVGLNKTYYKVPKKKPGRLAVLASRQKDP
jgi:hypothetical protein